LRKLSISLYDSSVKITRWPIQQKLKENSIKSFDFFKVYVIKSSNHISAKKMLIKVFQRRFISTSL